MACLLENPAKRCVRGQMCARFQRSEQFVFRTVPFRFPPTHSWFVSTHKHAADDGSRRLRWGVGRRGGDPAVQLALVIGLLAGILVMALIWVAFAMRDSGGPSAVGRPASGVSNADATVRGTVPSTGAGGPPPPRGGAPPAVPRRLRDCRRLTSDIAQPLRLAHRTLDRWAVHVGAMNKLMAGTISATQAKTFW